MPDAAWSDAEPETTIIYTTLRVFDFMTGTTYQFRNVKTVEHLIINT